MSGRLNEVGWVRDRFKSLYSDQPALSPIIEHPIQNPGREVLTRERDRDIYPLPDLIIESVPRHRDDDEPEEFYIKLERKMKKYYKKLFGLPRNNDSSATEYLNSEEDLNKAFIDDSSTNTNRDEESKAENLSFYEVLNDEIQCYDSNQRYSKVVASTRIADDDETDETDEDQDGEDVDAESSHSLILSSKVTRRHRYERRDSMNADTLKKLRVDEDWSVSSFQLEAGRIRESSEEMQQDDGADDGDDVQEENMIDTNKTIEEEEQNEENSEDYETIEIEEVDLKRRKEITPQRSLSSIENMIDNNKTIEEEEANEENSDDYETIEIEEVDLKRRKEITPQRSLSSIENMIDNNKTIEEEEANEENSDDYETIEIEEVDLMRRKENTPHRSSIRLALEGTVSPVTPTFTRQSLDLSKLSIERASEQVFDATPHFKNSFAPKTSTPRNRRSRKLLGDDSLDVSPAKMKCIGIQTCRDYLVDVETQTDKVVCKNVQVQVQSKLRRVMPEKTAARWR